jgi:hypothetical protein
VSKARCSLLKLFHNFSHQSKPYLIMIDFPPDIAPLEYNGVRYQQDWESKFEDREFAATYLSATDIKTNELLWVVKLCDCIKFAPGGPSRIGTVDITRITHGPDENELTIETIIESRYLVDLQTRTVTPLSKLMPVKKHQKIPQADPADPPMPPPWPRRQKR